MQARAGTLETTRQGLEVMLKQDIQIEKEPMVVFLLLLLLLLSSCFVSSYMTITTIYRIVVVVAAAADTVSIRSKNGIHRSCSLLHSLYIVHPKDMTTGL